MGAGWWSVYVTHSSCYEKGVGMFMSTLVGSPAHAIESTTSLCVCMFRMSLYTTVCEWPWCTSKCESVIAYRSWLHIRKKKNNYTFFSPVSQSSHYIIHVLSPYSMKVSTFVRAAIPFKFPMLNCEECHNHLNQKDTSRPRHINDSITWPTNTLRRQIFLLTFPIDFLLILSRY